MKNKLIIITLLLFIGGGFAAVLQGIDVILNVLKQFFPFFKITIERKLESYLKSPYFIVSVLTFVCSIFGCVLSANNKRVIYIVISSIILVISLVSIIGNFLICDL